MNKITFPFLLLLMSLTAIGQSNLAEAKTKLKQLKEGVILVRLFTNDAKISGLEAAGKTMEARKAAEQQQRENKDILLSFSQVFQFCPVYFFY